MQSFWKLVRLGFETAGAVQLLLQMGAAAVIAAGVGALAAAPAGVRALLVVGIFILVLAALLAYFGHQAKGAVTADTGAVGEGPIAATLGNNSPAAAASHSGVGDINIDQSTNHYGPAEEPLPFGGEPRIRKSIEELLDLYKQHTSLQADKLVESLINRPISAEGAVLDISDRNPNSLYVAISVGDKFGALWFSGDWRGRLAEIDRGNVITVVGRLHRVDLLGFALEECELEDVVYSDQADPEIKASDD